MNSPADRRSAIALAICFVSLILLGYACLVKSYSPVTAGVDLWLIWFQVAHWLGRTHWLLFLKGRAFRTETGRWRLEGLALGIERASTAWALAALGIWLFV